jgi:SpoIID/LytB domain protein
LRGGAAALTVVATVLTWSAVTATVASAYPTATVSLIGHGWGHGIGMGQWGALGYAVGQDGVQGPTKYQDIVSHYYAGTALTNLTSGQDATNVKIALTENDGHDLIATAPGGVSVPGSSGSAPAVLFHQSGSTFNVETGLGCAGPWTAGATGIAQPTTVASGGGTIQLCQPGGNLTVHGSLTALVVSGTAHTVNTLPLEQYTTDTAPGESPSTWGSLGAAGPQGQAWGFQELEAQAVAVRSYVMSNLGGWGGYADTCDLVCQTYRGTKWESSITNLAATDTAGQVMETPGGKVAVTQYSASTGGYTAGNQFPSVPDLGDAICLPGACNPNHTWHVQIPVSQVESTFPQIGVLQAVTVTARNGFGDLGGRVVSMSITGTTGSVNVTGNGFAAKFNLNSNWFAVTSGPSGGVGGYLLTGSDGSVYPFGNAVPFGSMSGHPLNQPVVGMAAVTTTPPTKGGTGYWLVASDGGMFSFGAAHFYGSMGGHPLNKPVVGMAPTSGGKGYWQDASDGGIFSFGDAHFYGSTGSLRLNKPAVGMAPTPDGKGYWLVASDGGIFAFGDAHFYGSTGALTLDKPVVGMASTPDGKGYWLVASDGGVFTFGDAGFEGSAAFTAAGPGTVALVPTATGNGYTIVNSVGVMTDFGDAPQFGNLAGSAHVVGAVPTAG